MDCNNRKIDSYYKIRGLRSNSASPTDTWLITYYDNTTKNIKCKSFIKLWIDPNSLTDGKNFYKDSLLALNYEAEVYEQIKKDIINTGSSSSFVKILEYSENNNFDQIYTLLKRGLELPDMFVSDQLDRNLMYIGLKLKNRPSISNRVSSEEVSILTPHNPSKLREEIQKLKYNYIETQSLEDSITFYEFIQKYKDDPVNVQRIYDVFFKILNAVNIMNNDNIFHQDLHFKNIFVDDKDNVYVYDFDRAYSENIGYNQSLEYYCEDYGNCNEIKQAKDFLKLFCGFYSQKLITRDIFKIILFKTTVGDDIKNEFFNKYIETKSDNCFLSKAAYNGLDNKYNYIFNTRNEILEQYELYYLILI
jgi:hypothetical protein